MEKQQSGLKPKAVTQSKKVNGNLGPQPVSSTPDPCCTLSEWLVFPAARQHQILR
jgi:hypothetical protein